MWGRGTRRQAGGAEPTEPVADETVEPEAEEPEEEQSEGQIALEAAEAQWREWDEEFEREEGPFDIEEVDLDADDVHRLDLGSLVVTPFEGMRMQVSVNREQVPQAIIVQDEHSAIEVALFGAPLRSAYVPEVRREIIQSSSQTAGSRIAVRRGPFGTEIGRVHPVQTPDGKQALQVTRTWLAEGPSWVLRGVVFGKAALDPDDEDATVTLTEFFANLVVRRGTDPVAPGAVIPFTLPDVPQAPGTEQAAE